MVQLVFSIMFALSCTLFELIIFEIVGIMDSRCVKCDVIMSMSLCMQHAAAKHFNMYFNCVCVCTRTRMHIRTCSACMHACVYTLGVVCTYLCMCAYVYVHMWYMLELCACVCARMYLCDCVLRLTVILMNVHTPTISYPTVPTLVLGISTGS